MCKYCEGKKSLTSNPMISDIYVSGNSMRFDTGFEEGAVEINFCPMCGRDLKESNR